MPLRKAVRSTPPAEPLEEQYDVPAPPVPSELLDPRTEFIVAMELVEPVSALQILHSQRDVLHRLNKPLHWVGFNERTREWERLTSDNDLQLRRLRVGLQLVNRMGPVSEGDLTIFTNAIRALADELMAVADMPSSRVLDQAAEIDRFCAAVDLEIGINLFSRVSAFSGTKIRALAEAAGMVLGIDGLFTRYDDEGRAQFSLQNYESTQFTADTVRHADDAWPDFPARCAARRSRALLRAVLAARGIREDLLGVVDDWARNGVTPDEVAAAIDKARAARIAADSVQPIPLRYVAKVVASNRAAARRAVERLEGRAPRAARGGVSDLEALAVQLGIAGSRPGEETEHFRARVMTALEKSRGNGNGPA